MDPLCEFCRAQRAVVYCKPDAARLCLACDAHVHSANPLARRHLRSLVCDRCLTQPAIVRCLDEKHSLCQSCDWAEAGSSSLGRRLPLSCYSGCPSLADLATIWSAAPVVGPRMIDANKNFTSSSREPSMDGIPNMLEPCMKHNTWMAASSSMVQKLGGFNAGNMDFSGDNNEEIYGFPQSVSRYHSQDEGMNCLLMERNFSVADSNCHIENAVEASSSGLDFITLQASHTVGKIGDKQAVNGNGDQVIANLNGTTNSELCFPTGNVPSNISVSLSNHTGESTAADYQDSGGTPMLTTGESPSDLNVESSCPQARNEAKMRYNEKKKSRLFGKQMKYASRKARADTRKQVKGRFIKACQAGEHDPLPGRST